jgi:hypothetical protein
VSPDKAFGKQLATSLKAAGGAVDLHLSLEELGKGEIQAALVVLHLDGELVAAAADIIPRLTGDARVIAILPRANLGAVVDTMQASERLAAMMVAETFDSRELAALATRALAGDIFGLEKMTHWGTLVHSQLVGDYQEKSVAISQISEFAELMGVRRKYRESIEQCVDEMLMNALYDAPVDDQGQPIFSEIPTKTRISLRVEQKVVVQYACDGKQFVVSVRDAFGTLERATVLRYLHKCLHAAEQIDRKVGGAGLGLYLMVNSSTSVLFNVLSGVATEVVCVFDLETPKLQLEQFGFFTEKIDAAGRLAAGPSKKLPAGVGHPIERRQDGVPGSGPSPGLVRALTIAILAMCVLIGFVAWPRLFGGKKLTHVVFSSTPPGAAIEIEGHNVGQTGGSGLDVPDLEIGRAYPVVARLDGYEPRQAVIQPRSGGTSFALELQALASTIAVDSQPTGAIIEVAGKQLGTTPLQITSLPPNTSVSVVFKKAGYQDASAKIEVPGPGKSVQLVQPLAVASEFARIKLASDPAGARVIQNGQLLVGVQTPTEVLVEAGKPVRFMLTMPHKVPVTFDTFTPGRGADGIAKHAKLADGFSVHIDSNLDGKVSILGVPHCQDIATPAECVIAKGNYTIEYSGPASAHVMRQFPLTGDRTEHIELGYVDAGANKQIVVGAMTAKHVAFEVGKHSVTVNDESGSHAVSVMVKAGVTTVAN